MRLLPKEKAEELVDKHRGIITSFLSDDIKKLNAIRCALITADELIKVTATYEEEYYFLQVIKEIENLKNRTK